MRFESLRHARVLLGAGFLQLTVELSVKLSSGGPPAA